MIDFQKKPQKSLVDGSLGGSIRSPAANNGVYGLRPTCNRLPILGCASPPKLGVEYIPATVGPLSTSLEGLRLFMKTVLDTKPWLTDPLLFALPWKEPAGLLQKNSNGHILKIGVLWDDNVVKPHPPVTRALNEMVQKLRTIEEVEVVDFHPYKHDLAWEIIVSQ